MVKLGSFNLDDEGKKYQHNGEAIQYIILNVLYNIEKDIANEIDIDKDVYKRQGTERRRTAVEGWAYSDPRLWYFL